VCPADQFNRSFHHPATSALPLLPPGWPTRTHVIGLKRAEGRFLAGVTLRHLTLPSGVPFSAVGLALGQGTSPLEVVVASMAVPPNTTTLRSAWKARNAGRAAPLVLVVLHGERASLCGPTGDDPPAYIALDCGQVERICREALEQPGRPEQAVPTRRTRG